VEDKLGDAHRAILVLELSRLPPALEDDFEREYHRGTRGQQPPNK
jgi:hypothetical protein